MYMKRPRTHQRGALREHVARAEKKNRYNRHSGGDRENERAFLERADRIVVASRALGKDDYRVPRSNSFGCDVVCGESSFTCLPLDWNHPDGPYGRAENGNFEELCFCDEFVSREHGRERGNVEPAEVIRHVDLRLTACHTLGIVNFGCNSGGPQNYARPYTRGMVEDAALTVLDSEHTRHDCRQPADRRGQQTDGGSEDRANHRQHDHRRSVLGTAAGDTAGLLIARSDGIRSASEPERRGRRRELPAVPAPLHRSPLAAG